jgi:hypothetical protein
VVQAAAQAWLAAFVRGDAAAMVRATMLPMHSNGATIKSAVELEHRYAELIDEEAKRAGATVEVLSPAGLRARTGAVPKSVGQGGGQLHALVIGASEQLILTLEQKAAGWKVVGVDR